MPQGRRIPLARLGVRMLLDQRLDQFTYLGRGPMENYADRKRGFDVGLYTSTVREQMTPYAKPMECGNHEDVRWAALSGNGSAGPAGPGRRRPAAGVRFALHRRGRWTPVEYTIDLPREHEHGAVPEPPARWASAPTAAARGRWISTSSGPSRPRSPTSCVCCRPAPRTLPRSAGSRRRRIASSRCSVGATRRAESRSPATRPARRSSTRSTVPRGSPMRRPSR